MIAVPEGKASFRPEDLWFNEKIMKKVEMHRNAQSVYFGINPGIVFKKGGFALKLRCYFDRIGQQDYQELVKFAGERKIPLLEITCNKADIKEDRREWRSIPRQTVVISLTDSLDEVWKSFDSKRRNQILKAGKEGVSVIGEYSDAAFEEWWRIYVSTSKRGKFVPYGKSLIEDLLKNGPCKLFVALYQGKVISGNVVAFNNYPYWWLGASLREYGKLNAPSILQWETIKFAKESGYDLYDLGGLASDTRSGPEKFKLSFNGEVVRYETIEISLGMFFPSLVRGMRHFYYDILKRQAL